LIDSYTFGGISGTDMLEQMLALMNVVVRKVKYGDNLEIILSGN
jgi:hypothetical protein